MVRRKRVEEPFGWAKATGLMRRRRRRGRPKAQWQFRLAAAVYNIFSRLLSPALKRFQEQLGAPFAFQVVLEADYVAADCFAKPGGPLIVPARTLLSQLL